MNKVYIEEVREYTTNKPLYWEVKESTRPYIGSYSSPFYLQVQNKDDALKLMEIININVDYYHPTTTRIKLE